MADKWLNARKKHREKVMKGESKFYNFDYKFLLVERFLKINDEVVEKEEGRNELEECIKENDFYSSLYKGQSRKKIEGLRKKHGWKYRSFRDLSQLSFYDLAKMALYGRLTQLKKESRDYIDNVHLYFKITLNTGKGITFYLEDPEMFIETGYKEWVDKKINDDPKFRQEVLGKI